MPDALQVTGVTKLFGSVTVLNSLDLKVAEGEIVALLGTSGGGKTTLLRLVAGMLFPDQGQILIGGRDATKLPPERRRLGYVFQDYALWPHLSARQHLELVLGSGAADRGTGGRVVDHSHLPSTQADRLLQTVGLLEHASRRPEHLSGGQRQRVALARALAVQPELVLLDEPYSALDPVLREGLRGEVAALLRAEGRAALHVTHDPDEALAVADRLVVLSQGTVIDEGVPGHVYRRPRNLASARAMGRLNELALDARQGQARLGELTLEWNGQDAPLTLAFRWDDLRPALGEEPGVTVTLESVTHTRGLPLGRYRLENGETVIGPRPIDLPLGGTLKFAIDRPHLFAASSVDLG